jgi:hypothetical protein
MCRAFEKWLIPADTMANLPPIAYRLPTMRDGDVIICGGCFPH